MRRGIRVVGVLGDIRSDAECQFTSVVRPESDGVCVDDLLAFDIDQHARNMVRRGWLGTTPDTHAADTHEEDHEERGETYLQAAPRSEPTTGATSSVRMTPSNFWTRRPSGPTTNIHGSLGKPHSVTADAVSGGCASL